MILVANADEKLRNFLVSMIKDQLDQPVAGAGSAGQVRQNLQHMHVDLLAIDPKLPDIDGFTLVKELRGKRSRFDLPIIVMSASLDRDVAVKSFESGANDFIALPFNPSEAMARLRLQLDQKKEFVKALEKKASTSAGHVSDPSTPASLGSVSVSSRYDDETTPDHLQPMFDATGRRNALIPCEMPITLFIDGRAYFCKTIWMTRQEMLALAFENFPVGAAAYRVQMLHPNGGSFEIPAVEASRQTLEDRGAGALKVNLKIGEAPEQYDELIGMLQEAYHRHGVSGLKSVMRGEDAAPLDDPLSSTMIFSSAASSTLNVIEGRRYTYKKDVGKGGFAAVYLVEDMALKRPVAMKVLNQEFSRLAEARNNFLREAQIAAQFHHPNIAFVYEVGEIHQEHYQDYLSFPDKVLGEHPKHMIYFTMQYIEGQTISKWIRAKRNESEERCVDVMIEIIKALAFAHSKDVIHRDIKPDNIMITDQSFVVVTDFGIATRAKAEPEPGQEADEDAPKVEVACTPKYASPEQLNGLKMDGRSDIYSFGIVAYQMLAGSAPFRGKTLAELVDKQLRGDPEPLVKKRPTINPRLAAIVDKCLQKKPEDRYQNAKDLLDDLLGLRGGAGDPVKSGDEETLDELLNQALLTTDSAKAAGILEKLIAFIKIHKTDDNVDRIQQIKDRLAEPALINLMIEKNLNKDNQQLLYEYFMELESTRVVLKVLHWFKKESERWKKLVLAELAVISAGRDVMPLVVYGLELPDREAAILLKGFGEIAPHCNDPIFFRWAHHRGARTQQELLKIINFTERPNREVLQILEYFAHAGGAATLEIKESAHKLLAERGKDLRTAIAAP